MIAMAISTYVCVLNIIICIPILHASKVVINTIEKEVTNNKLMYWIFFTKDTFLANIHEVHSSVKVEKQKVEGKTINTSSSKLNEYKHSCNHISHVLKNRKENQIYIYDAKALKVRVWSLLSFTC
jgi:hypothetical protein